MVSSFRYRYWGTKITIILDIILVAKAGEGKCFFKCVVLFIPKIDRRLFMRCSINRSMLLLQRFNSINLKRGTVVYLLFHKLLRPSLCSGFHDHSLCVINALAGRKSGLQLPQAPVDTYSTFFTKISFQFFNSYLREFSCIMFRLGANRKALEGRGIEASLQ